MYRRRFDPFRIFEDVSRWMEDFMSDVFGYEPEFERRFRVPRMPPVDMYEVEDAYYIEVELPGVNKDAIDIEVTDDTLRIKAEGKEESGIETENFIRKERRYASFLRTIRLPEDIDKDNIKAEYRNGILKIRLPKKEIQKVKGRKIRVD